MLSDQLKMMLAGRGFENVVWSLKYSANGVTVLGNECLAIVSAV